MDIINKSYKRKDSIESDTFTVESVDGDFVVFTNGARCKLATVFSDFEEIGTSNINEMVSNGTGLNPDTFFDTPLHDPAALQALDTIVTNPNMVQSTGPRADSRSIGDLENGPQKPAHTFNINDRLSGDTPVQSNNDIQEHYVAPTVNRLPEWDMFDRVKKTEEIEINIAFKIKLPRPEKIDTLNDMFETSFTMYLAKQYIKDNLSGNTITLQNTIQQSIEDWMEEEMYSDKPKKKTVKSKAKPVKKVTVAPIIEKEIETVVAPEASASDLFGGSADSNWDGVVKTLYIINTVEQYNAVNKAFQSLKDANSNSPDMDRYEDMIAVYEEQTKHINE